MSNARDRLAAKRQLDLHGSCAPVVLSNTPSIARRGGRRGKTALFPGCPGKDCSLSLKLAEAPSFHERRRHNGRRVSSSAGCQLQDCDASFKILGEGSEAGVGEMRSAFHSARSGHRFQTSAPRVRA